MRARTSSEFAASVMHRLQTGRDGLALREAGLQHNGLQASASAAEAPPLGHPDFVNLPLGGSGSTNAVALFLDLRRFTARSFWDPPEEILLVNVAVIGELATAVQQHGGHVLGFRGDGVFACFDAGQQDPKIAAALAVGTAAWALDAVKNAVNQLLDMSNIEPVQVRAGLDYGRLDFVRIGSQAGSEVNVLGFAANFAAKCEKAASSWEIVVGGDLAELLPEDDVSRHPHQPVTYTRHGQTETRYFFAVAPDRYLPHMTHVSEQLNGHPASAIGIS